MSGIVGQNPGRGSGVVGAVAVADNSVANSHLADNAVGLDEMAGGTDGNIISYDASGDPVAIATGSDGQVLTSTGAGSPPAFEAAAGGGFIRLGGAAFSGVTEVVISPTGFDMDSTVTTGYDAYKLFFTCDNSNASARFYVTLSEDGGSSWQDGDTSGTPNGYCQIGYGKDSGGSLDSNEYNLGAFWIGHDLVSDNDAEALWHVEITMIKPLAEAKPFTAHMQFTFYEGDNANTNGANMAWASHYTNAVDGIKLYPNGEGTIKGYWTMYGLKS